jgi:outer membrane scaffolding protein for murein synthesis (MipA/OmpV family)
MPIHARLDIAIVLSLSLAGAAHAQDPENYTLLGAGLRSRPAYDGSASQRTDVIPVVRYYGRPWFARTTQGILEGGARMEIAPGLAFGVQLAYEAARRASESAFLREHAIPDLHANASLGFHLEWDGKLGPAPVNVLLRNRQNATAARSDQIDLRGTAGIYGNGRVTAGVFGQATWATAKGTNTLYGVTPEQSAATGLPQFQAGSGVLFASVGLLGSYDISRQWIGVWSVEGRRLQGDARRSPLAERTSNYYASAGLAYRF